VSGVSLSIGGSERTRPTRLDSDVAAFDETIIETVHFVVTVDAKNIARLGVNHPSATTVYVTTQDESHYTVVDRRDERRAVVNQRCAGAVGPL
jgi:hypothetical protein